MEKIDRRIMQSDSVICANIDSFDASKRGILSQNILAQLRTFVEMISLKAYNDVKSDLVVDEDIPAANQYVKTVSEWNFLAKLHAELQISKSHYITDNDDAERLMLHYYRDLLKIRKILKEKYNLDVLHNIDKFPMNIDNSLDEYYACIASKLELIGIDATSKCTQTFYIQKIKPFFVNETVYYEVTLTSISDFKDKFNRIVAFTKLCFPINYAISISIKRTQVEILNRKMPIRVIDNWHSALRACEIDKFIAVLGKKCSVVNTKEYANLLEYLTESGSNLLEITDMQQEWFDMVFETIHKGVRSKHIYEALKGCRRLFAQNRSGTNILRYLLFTMRNNVIKDQYSNEQCGILSNLNLKYGCATFDQMPFASSLVVHNLYLSDVFSCISPKGKDYELLARKISNNTEKGGILYTERKDLKFCEREVDCTYSKKAREWLQNNIDVESVEKQNILCKLFEHSNVALIYGAAGTGKTKMIEYVARLFENSAKIFLTNTKPARFNLEQRVTHVNSEFYTVAKFIENNRIDKNCDILVIDECSAISNKQMFEILQRAEFQYLLLVGDIHQIESIQFGNWFNIARHFVNSRAIFELTTPYRTNNPNLLTFWNKVRNLEGDIVSYLSQCEYSDKLSEDIFKKISTDEIVLCLNYDGLYGINNLNCFLQQSNPHQPIYWNELIYKVGDPVLFNDSKRFEPVIYNNLKGTIIKIYKAKSYIEFTVKLDIKIKGEDVRNLDGISIVRTKSDAKSIIRFRVYRYLDYNDDVDRKELQMPFQVAYAVSIHKAQGLEYDSVKIVITNEIEEKITHNIFYTAITRTKNQLKIYWSPETQEKVISSFDIVSNEKDAMILAKKNDIKYRKLKRK